MCDTHLPLYAYKGMMLTEKELHEEWRIEQFMEDVAAGKIVDHHESIPSSDFEEYERDIREDLREEGAEFTSNGLLSTKGWVKPC